MLRHARFCTVPAGDGTVSARQDRVVRLQAALRSHVPPRVSVVLGHPDLTYVC